MRVNIRRAMEKYLEEGLIGYSANTRANLRRDMALWGLALDEIAPEALALRHLKKILKEGMPPSTARRRLASLRMAYSWWEKKGLIKRNPLEKILSASPSEFPFLHTGIHRTRYLTDAETRLLLLAAEAHLRLMEVNHFLLPALLLSGLRVLEALSIDRSELIFSGDAVWIQIEEGRRVPLSFRIAAQAFRQAVSLLSSLRGAGEGDMVFPFGRTPAERILRSLDEESGVETTASALRWRGIMDHLDHGMSIGVASLLFDISEKNLQRQYGFHKQG